MMAKRVIMWTTVVDVATGQVPVLPMRSVAALHDE